MPTKINALGRLLVIKVKGKTANKILKNNASPCWPLTMIWCTWWHSTIVSIVSHFHVEGSLV